MDLVVIIGGHCVPRCENPACFTLAHREAEGAEPAEVGLEAGSWVLALRRGCATVVACCVVWKLSTGLDTTLSVHLRNRQNTVCWIVSYDMLNGGRWLGDGVSVDASISCPQQRGMLDCLADSSATSAPLEDTSPQRSSITSHLHRPHTTPSTHPSRTFSTPRCHLHLFAASIQALKRVRDRVSPARGVNLNLPPAACRLTPIPHTLPFAHVIAMLCMPER